MPKVTVRIAVAVDHRGNWNSFGSRDVPVSERMNLASEHVDEGDAQYWLTAELEIPERIRQEIEATVEAEPK